MSGIAEHARPLAGLWVIITRPADRAEELRARLAAEGADCLIFPTIATEALELTAERERELRAAALDDDLVFTSQEGVAVFAEQARRLGLLPPRPAACLVAIGPATAAAIERALGRAADVVAADARAEGLLTALAGRALAVRSASLLRAEEGRALIPQALRAAGVRVRDLAIYRTTLLSGDPPPPLAGRRAWVVFTSGSTVRGFAARFAGRALRDWEAGGEVRYLAIGPPTADTAHALGFASVFTAERHDADGIVAALRTGGGS